MANFSDSFNRPDGSPGTDWEPINGGDWVINNNALLQDDTFGVYRGLRWNGGVFDSANFYARVTVSAPADVGFGVIVRCPTTGTTSAAIDGYGIVGFVDDQWYRVEFTDGSDAGYIGLGGTVGADVNYTIEIRADGDTITAFVDNVQLAQWTDTSYTTGGVMLVTYKGPVVFDNFEAADLASILALTHSAISVTATIDTTEFAVQRALFSAPTAVTVTTNAATVNASTVFPLILSAQNNTLTAEVATSIVLRRFAAAILSTTGAALNSILALLKPATFVTQATTLTSVRYGVRFYGNGIDQIDRMRIQLDDPADPPIDVGPGDFCYEFWMRCAFADNATTATDEDARYSNIILDRDIWSHERGWVLGVTRSVDDSALVVCFGVAGTGLTWQTVYGTSNVGDNRWHHIALTRSANTIRVFVDGEQEATILYSDDLSYPNGVRPAGGQDNPYLVIGTEKHDVGFGYNGDFAAFRVSNIARYTASFTPQQTVEVDNDTVALFLFREQTGTTAYDTSGRPGAEHAELLVGGIPAGPAWTTSGAVALTLLEPAVLAATFTTTSGSATVDTAALSVFRPLSVNVTLVTDTTVEVSAVLFRLFSSAISLFSNVAASLLTVWRSLADTETPATVTAQSTLATLRSMVILASAGDATANDVAMSILHALAQQTVGGTLTSNATLNLATVWRAVAFGNTEAANVNVVVSREAGVLIQVNTMLNVPAIFIARKLKIDALSPSETTAALVAVMRALALGSIDSTETSNAIAAVLRSLLVQIADNTITADAVVGIQNNLPANISVRSDTALILAAIQRMLYHDTVASTATNEADFRSEAIVGVLRILINNALRATIQANGHRPFIRIGD